MVRGEKKWKKGVIKIGKSPAYQNYASDSSMDTASWTNEEVGVFQRLKDYEWVHGSLPNDLDALSRIVREKRKKFEKIWLKNISKKFQENGGGNLINKGIEEIRENQLKYSESRRKNVSTRYQDKPSCVGSYVGSYVEDMNLPSSSSSSSPSYDLNKESIFISSINEILKSHKEQFQTKFKKSPIMDPERDGEIIRNLLKEYSVEELKSLLTKFFESQDDYILGSGYEIPVFKSQINKLVIGREPRSGMSDEDKIVEKRFKQSFGDYKKGKV